MPPDSEILLQAKALHRAGQVREAERLYRQVLAGDATNLEALCLLGAACHALGQMDQAVGAFQQAVRVRPDYGEAHHCLGIALAETGRLDEAIVSLQRAVELNPTSHEVAKNLHTARAAKETELALTLVEQDRPDEAAEHYRKALHWDPNRAATHGNFGNLLLRQGRLEEAAAAYRRVVELEPNSAEAFYNLGLVAKDQLKPAEALEWFRRALAIQPNYAQAHCSVGAVLLEQNQAEQAAAAFERAIELTPNSQAAHLGQAFSLLARGRFRGAWPHYEWHRPRTQPDDAPQPRWDGSPLRGRTILLRSEQGLGDMLQFIRYAGVIRQDGRVMAECRPGLARLLASCPGVDAVVEVGGPLGQFDVQIPLLSVPGLIGTTVETIPAEVPYLAPPEELVAEWQAKLNSPDRFKIGIAWQGDPTQPIDRVRSIPLRHFEGICRAPGVQVFSLQMGAGREQLAELPELPVIDLGDRPGGFEHTAAIMRNLDLVITSDSSPPHVAGALGVPVWVALSFAADWRWLMEREDCPWYPTMRLFRQRCPGDWAEVFRRIEQVLARLLSSATSRRLE